MIKAIIFDCFGVIRIDAFDAAYQRFGGDVSADKEFILQTLYDSNSGRIPSSIPVFAKRLGISPEVWKEAIDSGSTLNQDVLDYALELREIYKVGMLSNIGSGGLERMFEPGLLDIYFDAWVASGDIGCAKPEAQAYEITAGRLGVRLNEAVFIDDRQEYVDGAVSVGMSAILFTSISQLKKDLGVILGAQQ
ncbi:HAD family phosphatase [soil metagenome]